MTAKLTASLREAPATVPALAAVALFVIWATDQAAYPVTHWAPGALIVLVLLLLAIGAVGLRLADVPPAVRIALLCLSAYTALSFLSILWAAVPGDAWEGADRTLLYLLVFALFACWRQRGASAALLLCTWTVAMIGLAAFTALHVDAASGAGLQSLLPGGRLVYPSGYANANAAQWLMAFWPAVLLSRSARLPWGLRGLLAGGAVLLAALALLSQSRGSLYATPVMLVLLFVFLPGRTRSFAVLVPVLAGVGAAAPLVLRVGDRLRNGDVVAATTHTAVLATFVAALLVGLVVAVGAAAENRMTLSERSATRVRRAVAATGLLTALVMVAGGLAAAGNPAARVRHAWDTFRGGYAADSPTGSRLVSGLGSSRYDFYRVALDEFLAHPILGIGADNFQQPYLAHRRSDETPHYPHSVELRTLVETGLLGVVLALVGLAAALAAAARALRSSDPIARAVAAAALAGFVYWLVHGSFDWFWEFAGLGAPAFALLGIACALAPPRGAAGSPIAAETGTPGRDTAPARSRPPAPACARGAVASAAADRRGRARCACGGRLPRAALAQPAGGGERGAHLDAGSAERLLSPAGSGPPGSAQRRGVPGRGEHRPALRRPRARRPRVLSGSRADPRRCLCDARAGGDRLGPRPTSASAHVARPGDAAEPPRYGHPTGPAAGARRAPGQRRGAEPPNPPQS